ncbi:MAG: hypothetical protein ABIJ39_07075 [Chloroflexota bacterium]
MLKKHFTIILMLAAVLALAACSPAGQAGQAQPTPTVDIHCTETDPHPIGQSIAETYAVTYEQVMTWFCSGFSFDNILIALETGEAVDIPADTLLQMLLEKDWEQIWTEVGFTPDG